MRYMPGMGLGPFAGLQGTPGGGAAAPSVVPQMRSWGPPINIPPELFIPRGPTSSVFGNPDNRSATASIGGMDMGRGGPHGAVTAEGALMGDAITANQAVTRGEAIVNPDTGVMPSGLDDSGDSMGGTGEAVGVDSATADAAAAAAVGGLGEGESGGGGPDSNGDGDGFQYGGHFVIPQEGGMINPGAPGVTMGSRVSPFAGLSGPTAPGMGNQFRSGVGASTWSPFAGLQRVPAPGGGMGYLPRQMMPQFGQTGGGGAWSGDSGTLQGGVGTGVGGLGVTSSGLAMGEGAMGPHGGISTGDATADAVGDAVAAAIAAENAAVNASNPTGEGPDASGNIGGGDNSGGQSVGGGPVGGENDGSGGQGNTSGDDAGGYQRGGHFMIQDKGKPETRPDTVTVRFKGTPGEHVIVVPPGKSINQVMRESGRKSSDIQSYKKGGKNDARR